MSTIDVIGSVDGGGDGLTDAERNDAAFQATLAQLRASRESRQPAEPPKKFEKRLAASVQQGRTSSHSDAANLLQEAVKAMEKNSAASNADDESEIDEPPRITSVEESDDPEFQRILDGVRAAHANDSDQNCDSTTIRRLVESVTQHGRHKTPDIRAAGNEWVDENIRNGTKTDNDNRETKNSLDTAIEELSAKPEKTEYFVHGNESSNKETNDGGKSKPSKKLIIRRKESLSRR